MKHFIILVLLLPASLSAMYSNFLNEWWAKGANYDKNFVTQTYGKTTMLKSKPDMNFCNYLKDTITSDAITVAEKFFGKHEYLCMVKKEDESSNNVAKKVFKPMGTLPEMECDIKEALLETEETESAETRKNLKNFTIISIEDDKGLDTWADVLAKKYGRKDAFIACTKPFLNKDTFIFLGLVGKKPVATIQGSLGKDIMMLFNLIAPNKEQGWLMVRECLLAAYKLKTIKKAITVALPEEHEIIKDRFTETVSYNFYTSK